MKALRWLVGFFLLLLLFAYDGRSVQGRDPASLQPSTRYEQTPIEGRNYVYYTVQPGDSFNIILRKFRIGSSQAVLDLNPGLNPDRLSPNERIKIPL